MSLEMLKDPCRLVQFARLARKYEAAYFTLVYNAYDKIFVPRFFKSKTEMETYKKTADRNAVLRPTFFFVDMSKRIGPQAVAYIESILPKTVAARDALIAFLSPGGTAHKAYQKVLDAVKNIGFASELPAPAPA